MPGSGQIRAGRAFVELALKDTLAAGLNKAAGRLKAWGSTISSVGTRIAGIGAAITAPLAAAAIASAQSGAALYDMSKRTGVSVEELSKLGFAADMTGADLGALEAGLRRMQKTISGVADEAEGTTGSLDHLGISAAEIQGKSPEKQFAMIAAQLSRIKDPTDRATAAMKIFGRAGTGLLPMMDRLGELTGKAEKMGFVRSTASAKEQKEFSEALSLSTRAVKGLIGALGAAAIPVLKQKTEVVMRLTLTVRDWIKTNKSLITTIFRIASFVGIAGAAIAVLGTIVSYVGAALGVAAVAVTGVAVVLGAILTPIGLVIAELVSLAAYFIFATDTGAKVMAWLADRFNDLKTDALTAIKGISDALGAGDWKLAAQILWTTLKLEWQKGTNFLTGILRDWVTAAKVAWIDFGGWVANIWLNVADGLKSIWINVGDSLLGVMKLATKAFVDVWSAAISVVDRLLDNLADVMSGGVKLPEWAELLLSATPLGMIRSGFQAERENKKNKELAEIDEGERSGKLYPKEAARRRAIANDPDADLAQQRAARDQAKSAHLLEELFGHQAQYDKEMSELRVDHNRKVADLQFEHFGNSAMLTAQIAAERAKAAAGDPAAVAAAQAELDRLVAERDALVGKAADEKKTRDIEDAKRPTLPTTPTLPDPNDLQRTIKKIVTRGTFNALALQGLQGTPSDVDKQQLAAQRQATVILKDIQFAIERRGNFT